MKLAFQLFVCFGVPLIGVVLYFKLFDKVEDNIIFKIGLVNTIHYLACFSVISILYFTGVSEMALLCFSYLVSIAPILSFGFSYWLLLHKNELENYRYALFTSVSYVVFILCFFGLIYFKPGD